MKRPKPKPPPTETLWMVREEQMLAIADHAREIADYANRILEIAGGKPRAVGAKLSAKIARQKARP